MTQIDAEERARKTFEAAIGCTGAAVEFLRSVNKPINVTYVAQTAWDIAKKLEEFMEVAIKEGQAKEEAARSAPAVTRAVATVPSAGNAGAGAAPRAVEDDLDLVPLAPASR